MPPKLKQCGLASGKTDVTLRLIGTLSSGNADGDADAETGEKIGERTPL